MSGERLLTREIAEQFLADEKSVSLSQFTAIEDHAAEVISKSECEDWLCLERVEQLSDAAAESLCKFQGECLNLNGLETISDAAAASLSRFQGELWLNEIESLSDAAAESLGNHRGGALTLEGLRSLSVAAAESLSEYQGQLVLCVCLNVGLGTNSSGILTQEIAKKVLKKNKGCLDLSDCSSIEDEAANALCKFPHALWLDGLKSLSDVAAEYLSKSAGPLLELGGLSRLSDGVAESLSNYRGKLVLDGLEDLTDEAAKCLSKFAGPWLQLGGLRRLSDGVAESLSNYRGELVLDGLEDLTDEAAKCLSKFQCTALYLDSLLTLPKSAAAILKNYRGELRFVRTGFVVTDWEPRFLKRKTVVLAQSEEAVEKNYLAGPLIDFPTLEIESLDLETGLFLGDYDKRPIKIRRLDNEPAFSIEEIERAIEEREIELKELKKKLSELKEVD
jgi:hypothetical protein